MRDRGFTLIEVVVALAIVALALGGTLSIASSSANTTSYLERTVYAQWIAQNLEAALRLEPLEGQQSGIEHDETMMGRDVSGDRCDRAAGRRTLQRRDQSGGRRRRARRTDGVLL